MSGSGSKTLFQNEAGGHRWQRIPPTEKRGRVQTSTVTVAVLEPEMEERFQLPAHEVEISVTRGSGPGGQNRNMTNSCVIATHKPTGISVRIDMKSQQQGRKMALGILGARIKQQKQDQVSSGRSEERRQQVGSGMRGDKVRTYRTQDDRVTDHRTGQTWRLSSWIKGEW